MQHNTNTLQVSGYELPALSQTAFEAITCLPGKVAVEMSEEPDKIGQIYLPDKVSGRLRCDVGIVIGCEPGRDKNGKKKPMGIKIGDAVLVRPYHGAWFEAFESGTYSTKRQVRFYGIHGDPSLYQASGGTMGDKTDNGFYELVPWNESVVAKLVGNIVIPTHGNLLVRLTDYSHETIILPDGVKMPTTTAVCVGPGSSSFKRGDRLTVVPGADDLSIETDDELRLIRVDQVEAVIE